MTARTTTRTTTREVGEAELGDDPVTALVGMVRDLSEELAGLTERIDLLEMSSHLAH